MQTYVLKIRQGQDLNKELNEFVRVNDLKAAFVMSCVGGLSRASLRIGHMLIKVILKFINSTLKGTIIIFLNCILTEPNL